MNVGLLRAGFLAFVILLAVFCAPRINLSTDITNFMPDSRSEDLAVLARHLTHGDLARTMLLTVGTASGTRDDERVAAAVQALSQDMGKNPEVAWVRIAPQESELESVWKTYFPRRFGLVSLVPEEEIPSLVQPEAIATKAAQTRDLLASATGPLIKRMLPGDPLGLFGRILERMRDRNPSLEVRRGVFFSQDGFGVLILATRDSAFDSAHQGPFLADVNAAFATVNAKLGGGLVLEMSGANRFALDAERAMKGDMGWIGVLSFVGVAVLFLAFFRSPNLFLLAMLPAVTGIVVAAATGILVFGHLDGLTLAFGVALIGGALDYPLYLLNHLARVGDTPRGAVARLAPSISMGALTTMASFAGLALTSFPGFREIGFFSVVGVGISLAATLGVVPIFIGKPLRPTVPGDVSARLLGRMIDVLHGRRSLVLAAPLLVAVLGIVVLPQLQWQDDLSKLGNTDPALQSEEKRVRERVSTFEMGRVAMIMAADEQQALERTEEIARRLQVLQQHGDIDGFRSVTNFVWSAALQRRNIAALRSVPDLADRVVGGFVGAGFRAESFAPFRKDFVGDSPPPVTVADLQGTGLDLLLQPLVLQMSDRTATITQIRGPHSEDAVREAVSSVPGASYFVQRDFVNELYAKFRNTTLRQVLVGCVLVVLTLAVRYRRWRPAFAAFLPSAMVPVVVLSGFQFAGVEINLLHVISLTMVMGMGVDYAIFLVDGQGDPKRFNATLVSLLLSCLTTVFVFGVLAISAHPALRAMGMTTGAGVLLSLLFAPVSLAVLGPGGAPRTQE